MYFSFQENELERRFGRYVTHKTQLDFDNETQPINDDFLIMKQVANMFGLSHIYAFYYGYLEDSDSDYDPDESENKNKKNRKPIYTQDRDEYFPYKVKFGILPKNDDQSMNIVE